MRPTYPMALDDRASSGALPRARKVYFEVFGCQMNKLDAELMLETLRRAGYELTHDDREAGVVLFHTCSVRWQAENRVCARIQQYKRRKREEPELVIGLTGCVAQHHEGELLERLPQLDLVVGTREFHRMPDLIAEVRASGEPIVATAMDSPLEFLRTQNLGPNPAQAYISVMRGCDMVCTYCVVPATRGREESRRPESIFEEARHLAEGGVREVTLLGQTVNSYGKRLGLPGVGLHTLLRGLEDVCGIERVRFITSHPRFMRPLLIEAMAECSKTCEYLHLPVQSGSDGVLKRMKRTYDRRFYVDIVARCRVRIPDFAIATDFIVGFPGETDSEFEESLSLVDEIGFDHGYVFDYSPRPGTEAFGRADDIPPDLKSERHRRLLAAVNAAGLRRYREWIGRRVEVLVEGPSKSDPARWTGRTRDHRIVVWPHLPSDRTGDLVLVDIEGATALTLRGLRVGVVPDAATRNTDPRRAS